jgi:thiamine biosynthesis protein ThiC
VAVVEHETYTINTVASAIICPACRAELPTPTHVDVGVVAMEDAAHAASIAIAQAQEEAIIEHYQRVHRFRYWLYMRTAWKRVLG